ncbi:hypothetical protein FRB94_001956, partial [Tulasnella sp. JGI-2019a]
PSLWLLLQAEHIDSVFKAPNILIQNHVPADNKVDGEVDNEGDNDQTQLEEEISEETESYKSIGHWLQCICHWIITLHELCNGFYRKRLREKDLVVRVVYPPTLAEPNRQASLTETMAFLKLSSGGKEKLWAKLKEMAGNTLVKLPTVYRQAFQDGKADESWATSFSGRVHCESYLVSLMSSQAVDESKDYSADLKKRPRFIGVSERCCFLCSEFMAIISDDIHYSGTHGKVYPWALPKLADPQWEQQIIEKLARELKACLTTNNLDLKQAEDDGSGSEDSWELELPEELDVVRGSEAAKAFAAC